jgi:hypothetical protein
MSRKHIREAEARLAEAKRDFYSGGKDSAVREHLICAIRHITKVLLSRK